ncbi:hypothetical protein Tco_0786387 [Tanacetum coccineum]
MITPKLFQSIRVAELERDNKRLRGTMSVESQRVDRLQRGMVRMQRELKADMADLRHVLGSTWATILRYVH